MGLFIVWRHFFCVLLQGPLDAGSGSAGGHALDERQIRGVLAALQIRRPRRGPRPAERAVDALEGRAPPPIPSDCPALAPIFLWMLMRR